MVLFSLLDNETLRSYDGGLTDILGIWKYIYGCYEHEGQRYDTSIFVRESRLSVSILESGFDLLELSVPSLALFQS